jgi:hypothetical protein
MLVIIIISSRRINILFYSILLLLAPEVLSRSGYGTPIDMWAMG